jgi:drug/metabolite transporter (DMT)-like permease
VHPHTDRKKILTSIALALAVGISSASYSTIDALAVRKMNPVVFLCLMNILSTTSLFPFLYKYHYDKTIIALTVHWKTILLISPCVVCSYLIILMVFSIFKVSVALVVAVRTSSVLLGSFIGVVFLGERYSIIKFTSILVMCVGIVIIKFG